MRIHVSHVLARVGMNDCVAIDRKLFIRIYSDQNDTLKRGTRKQLPRSSAWELSHSIKDVRCFAKDKTPLKLLHISFFYRHRLKNVCINIHVIDQHKVAPGCEAEGKILNVFSTFFFFTKAHIFIKLQLKTHIFLNVLSKTDKTESDWLENFRAPEI